MYIFPNAAQNNICVIGDIMLDHYLYGTCDRISPEAPVQVVDVKREVYTLGGAGNVLDNLIAFGAPSCLISICGCDKGAETVENILEELGVNFYNIINDLSRKTTIKTRVVSNKHQLLRLDVEDRHLISDEFAEKVLEAVAEKINNFSVLIMSDYCKGFFSEKSIQSIINLCKQRGVKTIVDSKDPHLAKYYNADIIKPNKKEASIATGINIVDDITLEQACEKITLQTNCSAVVITLSEEGMAIYENSKLVKIPTRALEVYDVTGAGDTVIAALAFATANGLSLVEASDFANHAAAVVVAKIGSATATLSEINNLKQ